MAVIVEDFLNEYEAKYGSCKKGKKAWKEIREELYKRRSNRNKDIPNDTVAKEILTTGGRWDSIDGSYLLSKWFRDYSRSRTDFIGNGGFPV